MRIVTKILLIAFLILKSCPVYSLSEDMKEMAIKKGEEASQSLVSRLQTELKTAIDKGGYVNAIEVCSKKAREIYLEIAKKFDALEVKRVSDRFRNPYSRPDELDAATLREFYNSSITENERPKYIVKERKKEIVFYKPIYVGEMCLKCHGQKDELDPIVLEKINKIYPNDVAKGYKLGEFYGFIRITFNPDSLKRK